MREWRNVEEKGGEILRRKERKIDADERDVKKEGYEGGC